MDISVLDKGCIKIRGRLGSVIVDPSSTMPKNSANGIMLQNPSFLDTGLSRVLDYSIVISGPGDYEVGGLRVFGKKGVKNLLYRLLVDDVRILLGKASELLEGEKINVCDILLIHADSELSESFIASFDPKVVLLYGTEAKDVLKLWGKETLLPVKKFVITKEKLPEELEIVFLG